MLYITKCQLLRYADRQTDRQTKDTTDRRTDRQQATDVTQLHHNNLTTTSFMLHYKVSAFEVYGQTDRQTKDRQADKQTDRRPDQQDK